MYQKSVKVPYCKEALTLYETSTGHSIIEGLSEVFDNKPIRNQTIVKFDLIHNLVDIIVSEEVLGQYKELIRNLMLGKFTEAEQVINILTSLAEIDKVFEIAILRLVIFKEEGQEDIPMYELLQGVLKESMDARYNEIVRDIPIIKVIGVTELNMYVSIDAEACTEAVKEKLREYNCVLCTSATGLSI